MSSFNFPRTHTLPLIIRRNGTQLKGALVVVRGDQTSGIAELAAELLGPAENTCFSSLRSVRRQRSYLFGRCAAKLALQALLPELDLRTIEIGRGVFEQPIVSCGQNQGWNVTISHTNSLACALAFPTGHPMGVDVEQVDWARYGTIVSQLSEQETKWVEATTQYKLQLATSLWTAKEALSKALCTGLMSPVKIYNLSEFRPLDSGKWEGLFENFGQYKAATWWGNSHVLSVALPKRSLICFERNVCELL
ncbi:MAG: 4'-phosphopantetheinyl transferase superfamily protein [Verrucomicrobia bacterium]|nr:4'-phosphopantetheinyl transferase superfamily protein [Verrucomicrobiota bacterium]